jgi:hypothetical protein
MVKVNNYKMEVAMKHTLKLIVSIIGLSIAFAPLHGASRHAKRRPVKQAAAHAVQHVKADESFSLNIISDSLKKLTAFFSDSALREGFAADQVSTATEFIASHFYLIINDTAKESAEQFFALVSDDISKLKNPGLATRSDILMLCLQGAYAATISPDFLSPEDKEKLTKHFTKYNRGTLPLDETVVAAPKDRAAIAREAAAELARLKNGRAIAFARGYTLFMGITRAVHHLRNQRDPKQKLITLACTKACAYGLAQSFDTK